MIRSLDRKIKRLTKRVTYNGQTLNETQYQTIYLANPVVYFEWSSIDSNNAQEDHV